MMKFEVGDIVQHVHEDCKNDGAVCVVIKTKEETGGIYVRSMVPGQGVGTHGSRLDIGSKNGELFVKVGHVQP